MANEREPMMERQKVRKLGRAGKGKKQDFFIVIDDTNRNPIIITDPEKKAKGGRAGFKSGSKGCKLAMKGKGRAYGKNS